MESLAMVLEDIVSTAVYWSTPFARRREDRTFGIAALD